MSNIINSIYKYKTTVNWRKRPLAGLKHIVVHHSAYAQDNQSNEARLQTMKGWHVNNGWAGLSYHYAIMRDGSIYQINHDDDLTWTDSHNSFSLSILVDGYFHHPKNDQPTPAQLKSLHWLAHTLQKRYSKTVHGDNWLIAHKDISKIYGTPSTACCGDVLYNQLPAIKYTPLTEAIPKPVEQPVKPLDEPLRKYVVKSGQGLTHIIEDIDPRIDINQSNFNDFIWMFGTIAYANGVRAENWNTFKLIEGKEILIPERFYFTPPPAPQPVPVTVIPPAPEKPVVETPKPEPITEVELPKEETQTDVKVPDDESETPIVNDNQIPMEQETQQSVKPISIIEVLQNTTDPEEIADLLSDILDEHDRLTKEKPSTSQWLLGWLQFSVDKWATITGLLAGIVAFMTQYVPAQYYPYMWGYAGIVSLGFLFFFGMNKLIGKLASVEI